MSIVCLHCFSSQKGKSKVMLTRKRARRVTLRGKPHNNQTIVRTRQCLNCKFKWKTIEVLDYEIKQPRGQIDLNDTAPATLRTRSRTPPPSLPERTTHAPGEPPTILPT